MFNFDCLLVILNCTMLRRLTASQTNVVFLTIVEAKCAVTCDFQQCGILTSVDSDEPLQTPFKLRNSK